MLTPKLLNNFVYIKINTLMIEDFNYLEVKKGNLLIWKNLMDLLFWKIHQQLIGRKN